MLIPSPAFDLPMKLLDGELGYKFIEFPEDTFFMESLAQNAAFRAGGVAYVPVRRFVNDREESHLYEIQASSKEAKHLAGPIAAPDGSLEITIFGCALSDDGILYMCAFNRNSVISCDLKKLPEKPGPITCEDEIHDLSAPNDVAIDPKDPTLLYVAGGTFTNVGCVGCGIGSAMFSDATTGQIFRVHLDTKNIHILAGGLKTLAGIEVINDTVWIAQLVDIIGMRQSKNKADPADNPSPFKVWEGDDANDICWLADNIDVFDGDKLLCPAFSTVSKVVAKEAMSRSLLMSAGSLSSQLATAIMRREEIRKAIRDPEVALSFSNTFIKKGYEQPPIRLIFLSKTDQRSGPVKAHHFEIDLAFTRCKNPPRNVMSRDGAVLGQRHFFNEQVTHAAHLLDPKSGVGYVACVNFEQPRILLLEDKIFREAIAAPAVEIGNDHT